nr:MAG TPA: Major capsid protein [Microviridae sp.]
MSIQRNIGKNTIGDNKKMEVDLKTYNRSTHNLSTVIRNTQSPGTLVPTCTIVMQKDDTFEINIESSVLTHPTTGPLYGSFKLENHVFFIPFRLYNSWLHNNRLGVGLDMSQIKLPQLYVNLKKLHDQPGEEEQQWSQINPSCLLSYLGIKGYGGMNNTAASTTSTKNAVKVLGYWDIFKNFYANKQETDYYMIGSNDPISIEISGNKIPDPNNIPQYLGTVDENGEIIIDDPLKIYSETNITLWVTQTIGHSPIKMTVNQLGTGTWNNNVFTIHTTKIPSGNTYWIRSIRSIQQQALVSFPLEEFDTLRDEILGKKGNQTFYLGDGNSSTKIAQVFNERGDNQKLKTTRPQYGLLLKTYNSDLYQNWINTEWIDGTNGINEITAVDVSDGTLSMDSLNLQQKVYNMLNRIAISGGSYRDWLETVYASGQYIERCETPTFEGGTSQEIVFQEVVSNSASEDEPLGTLAGRGINAGKQKGGKIKIRATEPGYMMCITSITPRIDYSQGNDFDSDWISLDDMHKPALDGIGYQDSVNTGRAWWDDTFTGNQPSSLTKHTAGKTVAWIDYMTNVNRTYGNFAAEMSEAFMVLNRNYEIKYETDGSSRISDLTTYIDPVKYNYIFADASIDAMNFWVQIKFDITARRLMSAKQIPNL